MNKNRIESKEKGHKHILAICYDFDKTLSPDDMLAQGCIQSLGCEVIPFWKETSALACNNDMDSLLAEMYIMLKKQKPKGLLQKKYWLNTERGLHYSKVWKNGSNEFERTAKDMELW